jgi:hypothetical protein
MKWHRRSAGSRPPGRPCAPACRTVRARARSGDAVRPKGFAHVSMCAPQPTSGQLVSLLAHRPHPVWAHGSNRTRAGSPHRQHRGVGSGDRSRVLRPLLGGDAGERDVAADGPEPRERGVGDGDAGVRVVAAGEPVARGGPVACGVGGRFGPARDAGGVGGSSLIGVGSTGAGAESNEGSVVGGAGGGVVEAGGVGSAVVSAAGAAGGASGTADAAVDEVAAAVAAGGAVAGGVGASCTDAVVPVSAVVRRIASSTNRSTSGGVLAVSSKVVTAPSAAEHGPVVVS